jgi:hypothetical protein
MPTRFQVLSQTFPKMPACLGLLLVAVLCQVGCSGGSQQTPAQLIDRVTDIRGPEGRYRIPLDYAGGDAEFLQPLGGEAPEAKSDAAKVTVLTEGERYKVAVPTLPNYLSYQQEEDWCWAAATHTIERFKAGVKGEDYTTTQREVVQRIFPDPEKLDDRKAFSMQVAMAMVDADLRKEATMLKGQDVEDTGPTADFFNNIVDITAAIDLSTEDLISYLDQYMGAQELIKSLAAGEPVIVSLLEKNTDPTTGAEQAYAHLYVIYGVDVVAIDVEDSREADVRNLHTAAQTIRELEKQQNQNFWGQSADSIGGTIDFLGSELGNLISGDEQMYALERVYLVDPWKYKKDPTPKIPKRDELTGEQFAMRNFYMLNKQSAERVVKEFIKKRNQSEQDINQDVEDELD